MLSVTRKILVSAPKEHVSEYLRDLSRLADYGQKVDSRTVAYTDPHSAVAEISGRCLGLPWRGSFRMKYTNDGGYRSDMIKGPPLKSAACGFHLRPVTGGTVLTHDEQYHLPSVLRPFRGFLERWLVRTMEVELAVIKEESERLHRRRMVEEIDRDVLLEHA